MSEHIYEDSDMENERYHVIPFGSIREEIVRCWNCRYHTYADKEHGNDDWCEKHGHISWSVNGFCAWGERRKIMDAELFNKIDAAAWEEFVRCYGPENRAFVRNVNIGEDDNGCWAVVYDFKPYSRFVEAQVNVSQNENMDAFCVYAHPEPQKTMPQVYDNVEKPKHYTSGNVECIDWIRESMDHFSFLSYCRGNALKYIWRYEDKGGEEDLRKAIWYLNHMVDEIKDYNE